MSVPIQFRRGTTTERESVVLDSGEPGWDTTQQALYIGDGTTLGGIAVGGFTDAPEDGLTYGRKDGNWSLVSADSGIEEAPSDGKLYGRRDESWQEVEQSSADLPPPPPLSNSLVYGVDPFGVPGWVPQLRYVGATLWPAKDANKGTTEPTFGYSNVIFDDADEHGQKFFEPGESAVMRERLNIIADGLYVLSFSVSFPPTTPAGMLRARIFKNGNPIVLDLLGRTAPYFSGGGSGDVSGVSAPQFFKAGDYLTLGVLPAVTIMHAARSSWLSIQRVS